MTCPSPLESMVKEPSSSSLTSGPKAVTRALHKAFSDFKFYGLKSIAEDDGGENIVATRIELTGLISSNPVADCIGVHTGEFMGVPPTGKSVVGRFVAFDRIEGNKLVSSEVFLDVAGLLIQFGVMPPPKGF
jgi:predicted ester cyclase